MNNLDPWGPGNQPQNPWCSGPLPQERQSFHQDPGQGSVSPWMEGVNFNRPRPPKQQPPQFGPDFFAPRRNQNSDERSSWGSGAPLPGPGSESSQPGVNLIKASFLRP